MKTSTLMAVVFVALSALVGTIVSVKVFSASDEPEVRQKTQEAVEKRGITEVKKPADRKKHARPSRRPRGTNGVSRVRRKIRIEDPYTPEERKLADNLQSALDENELEGVRAAVKKIAGEKNPDLKVEAVDALAFFGKAALNDLTGFLRDPSQDVIDSASDAISRALDELEESENKFKLEFVQTLMSAKDLCSEDAVNTFAGQIESVGSDDEKLAVQTIVQLIADENVSKLVKNRMKESYEFVTGEEYTTVKAAEAWYSNKLAEEAAEAEDGAADEDSEAGEAADDGNESTDSAVN